MDKELDTSAAFAAVQQCLANVLASLARQTTSSTKHNRLAKRQQASMEAMGCREAVIELATDT